MIQLVNLVTGEVIHTWENIQEAIERIAKVRENAFFYARYYAWANIEETMAMNPNDLIRAWTNDAANAVIYKKSFDSFGGYKCVDRKAFNRRPYMYIEDGRIIDMRLYLPQIKEAMQRFSQCRNKPQFEYGEQMKIGHSLVRFRIDPIPNWYRYRGRFYRIPSTLRDKKMNTDPELNCFIRSKRKQLPSLFTTEYRSDGCDRCWKRKKIRHQWEKNI